MRRWTVEMTTAHAIPIGFRLPTWEHPSSVPAGMEGSTVKTMAATAATDDAALAVEEARLARAAAGGDGDAFATLYERYEQRAFNLAYRIAGSEHDAAEATQEAFVNVLRRLPRLDDRELAFGSYLFTATRNACYDVLESRRRTQPSEAIPESATPLGAGAGGAPDPPDPEDDPDRKLLLESQQEEIRAANLKLPERQREALALRELEQLSYDEIAAIMEMNRNSVAQLISRARINLRDELRGTALAAMAGASAECERVLPLIAMRDDGQLDAESTDGAWLAQHLGGCERCRLGVEAMQEAGVSYRAWAPIAAAPWLFRETMARAAEATGSDWSEVERPRVRRRRRRRRGAALLAGAVALLLGGALAVALADEDPSPLPAPSPAAAPAPPPVAKQRHRAKRHARHRRRQEPVAPSTDANLATPAEAPPVTNSGGGGSSQPKQQRSGAAGLDAGQGASPPQAEQPTRQSQPTVPPETTPPPADPPSTTEPEPEPEPEPERPPREPPAGGPLVP
jgi:RNA polymerase sigma factor (sigma-70 family)